MRRILIGAILVSLAGCVEDDYLIYRQCLESEHRFKMTMLSYGRDYVLSEPSRCRGPIHINPPPIRYTEKGEPVIQLGPHHGVTEQGKEVYIP